MNGARYSVEGTSPVLPKHPIITGICPPSPSRKNPRTVSPGLILGLTA